MNFKKIAKILLIERHKFNIHNRYVPNTTAKVVNIVYENPINAKDLIEGKEYWYEPYNMYIEFEGINNTGKLQFKITRFTHLSPDFYDIGQLFGIPIKNANQSVYTIDDPKNK